MPLTITFHRRTVAVVLAFVVAVVLAFVLGLLISGRSEPALADTPAPAQSAFPGITVTGLGQASGAPDTLVVNLSVRTTGADVSTALSQANNAMNRVRGALGNNGVSSDNIKTSGVSLNPNYQYNGSNQQIDGYNATESVAATLHDLKNAGAAISAASKSGGNAMTIDGVSFDVQNDSALLSTARAAAFANAKAKAQQYASAAGRSLGPVVRIGETIEPPTVTPSAAGSKDSAPSPVPISPGTTRLSVTVDVVFGLA
ncbi:SIMPL domain-containing protein [Fodinicola feengrottensis]|uniref:SIMPL domain-containing protein n=1 Tax=Fodinicola feengrottensis TaxID=435914 RepID=A0ABP4UB07_9ACTN|nr:SIMPL domain-containing protein [Fodinicola feengrottensis]